MFYVLVCLLYIVICVALIFFILIQSNKGMGLSGAFGAVGGSDSVFGSSGSLNVIIKITISLGVIFGLFSLALSIYPPPQANISIVGETSSGSPGLPLPSTEVPAQTGGGTEQSSQGTQPSGAPQQ